jgi:hypothetical protein
MTFVRLRVAIAGLAIAATVPGTAGAQRNDSYTWMLGINAGAMAFQTVGNLQTTVVPSAGAHFLVMAGRGGLMVGVDEGIGTNEKATDNVLFNDVRRYQGVLMAFPVSGSVEPYFGVGGGILQVVGPRVDHQQITDPVEQAAILADARDRSATGFVTILAGIQGHLKRATIFAQYEASTSPSDDKLLHGSTQTLLAGLRFGLGSAREGVAAGGY